MIYTMVQELNLGYLDKLCKPWLFEDHNCWCRKHFGMAVSVTMRGTALVDSSPLARCRLSVSAHFELTAFF